MFKNSFKTKGDYMNIFFGVIFILGVFVFYDLIRRVNQNILIQTEEIKKLQEELKLRR